MRFDSAEASEIFFKLRYLDQAYQASSPAGIRLPPVDQSVSSTASSGGMVYKAFPNGLMYADQLALMGGGGLFVGLIAAFMLCKPLIFGGNNLFSMVLGSMFGGGPVDIAVGIFFSLAMLIVSPFVVIVVLSDLVGFRFETCVLFDRHAGKIHLFSDQSVPLSPWRYHLKSYDWTCVRGEIDTEDVATRLTIQKEAGLRCVVLDRPGGDTIVDKFVLGVSMPAHNVQPLLDTWEHVRRFMQHEGPLFADQHDNPNPSLGRQSLWSHLMAGPALHLVMTAEMFEMAWKNKSPFSALGGVICVLLLPMLWVLMLWGFLPWLSGLVKRDPVWPDEIIASVGGSALSGKALETARSVLPAPIMQSPHVNEDAPGSH